ncbi:MAG TPA: beta-galactosidase [Planctomycetota bacterium]|nr:beta-galactosidase [Planctomycetota bacterium]
MTSRTAIARWFIAPFMATCLAGASPTSGADSALTVATSTVAPLTLERTLPEIALRGYGKVFGKLWNAGALGSVLEITCASADQAKLTLAKYVSDLHLLPGVDSGTLSVSGARWGAAPVTIHTVQDQGIIAALCSVNQVFIVASSDQAGLQKLLGNVFSGNASSIASTAETTVPMWLDRFDRYGFRHYYAPFTHPPQERMPVGVKREAYDFTQDFAFAKEHQAGLVLWSTLSQQASAEGMTNQNWWGWVQPWAKAGNIPLGINLSAYNYDLPNWMANRFRSQLAEPMPHYLGDSMSIAGERGTGGKVGELAWGATSARDAMFGSLQQVVRRYAKEPNVVSWLEPHGEFYQGGDAFMGHGPAVDATFREFVTAKYRTIAALNAAWGVKLTSFDAVKAPELAEFAGWNADALDLAGQWHVGHPKEKAPDEWFTPGFDDTAWMTAIAPGDDHAFFLPKQPAVYRRAVEVPAAYTARGKRAWIYLWDLNTRWDQPVSIWLNGTKIGESKVHHPHPHWMVAEATAALKAGANQLSIAVPGGYIAYRVYLSHSEPKDYPALGSGLNAKWVDFVAWREAMRMASAKRGIEMIREVDPGRQIDLMAPHHSADGLKGLAEQYGANFKDTGFMGGVWAELLPQLMRGSGLPFSLEPGGPPRNVPEMRRMLGLYHSEGIQAMDYFIHIGDVMWDPAIRQAYEETQPLWHAFGKYHCHQAELAILWHMGIETLTGFPWGGDLNTTTWSGWSCRQIPESLLESHPRDGITEGDFARGNAAKYKVIIDTNTSIINDELLVQIEQYVRGGGTFITTGQTGRHSPTMPNTWPICKLTGYEVLTYDTFPPDTHGGPPLPPPPGSANQSLAPAPGQTIYTSAALWMSHRDTGLRLKKVAADTQDLLLWQDGTVAVGMRPLGTGRIIQFGYKEPGAGVRITPEAFFPILDHLGVRRNEAKVEVTCASEPQKARGCFYREYVSNNGLYDVWMLFNDNREHMVDASVVFKPGGPVRAYDVLAGKDVAITDGRLAGVKLAPFETRMFLTPRAKLAAAPAAWFDLQRSWWKGTTSVTKGFPAPSVKYRRTLDDGWVWTPASGEEQSKAWADPSFDASSWKPTDLGVLSFPEQSPTKQLAVRKVITVPKE